MTATSVIGVDRGFLKKSYAVIGLSKFGFRVATGVFSAGFDVLWAGPTQKDLEGLLLTITEEDVNLLDELVFGGLIRHCPWQSGIIIDFDHLRRVRGWRSIGNMVPRFA